jgi:hypothetical protein
MLRVAGRRPPRPKTYFTTSNRGRSAGKRDGPRRFPRQPPPLPACRSARGHDGIVGGARSAHIEIDRRSIDCSVDGTHLTELDRAMPVSPTACSRRRSGQVTPIGLGGSGVVPAGIGRELYCSIRWMTPGPPLMLSELASGHVRDTGQWPRPANQGLAAASAFPRRLVHDRPGGISLRPRQHCALQPLHPPEILAHAPGSSALAA